MNMNTLVEYINAMEVHEEDENYKNAVDFIFEKLEKGDPKKGTTPQPQHFAVRQYKKYKLAAGKTAKSILISCGARLAPFDIAELRERIRYEGCKWNAPKNTGGSSVCGTDGTDKPYLIRSKGEPTHGNHILSARRLPPAGHRIVRPT
jgi:hypothetical protein